MQIDFNQLTNQWVALKDLITVQAGVTYCIQNRGADPMIAQESATAPASDNMDGTMVYPADIAVYIKGSTDLYLRAFNSSCSINITEVE